MYAYSEEKNTNLFIIKLKNVVTQIVFNFYDFVI